MALGRHSKLLANFYVAFRGPLIWCQPEGPSMSKGAFHLMLGYNLYAGGRTSRHQNPARNI
jgi:hypothetical protein